MIALHINIDHVATVRQARQINEPDPVTAAGLVELAGADGITFHIEAADNPDLVIDLIRSTGKQVGISLKPNTPLYTHDPYLDKIDLVLIMSVEPGFGGQGYLPGSSDRIKELKLKYDFHQYLHLS